MLVPGQVEASTAQQLVDTWTVEAYCARMGLRLQGPGIFTLTVGEMQELQLVQMAAILDLQRRVRGLEFRRPV